MKTSEKLRGALTMRKVSFIDQETFYTMIEIVIEEIEKMERYSEVSYVDDADELSDC